MLRTSVLAAALIAAVVGMPESAQCANVGSVAKTKKWRGRATATCMCANGQCKIISCEVVGAISYEAAKNSLKFNLEGKARNENGRIVGEISFSISADLF